MTRSTSYRFDTKLIHSGYDALRHGSITPPLFQTVAYPFASATQAARIFAREEDGFTYARIDNPTCQILEKRLAELEQGEAALCTSSGMAAIFMAAIHLAEAGDEAVSCNRVYGGTFKLFTTTLPRMGVKVRLVEDPTSIEAWNELINDRTRFLYAETPSNPNLFVSDIQALAQLAHDHAIPLILDNTICSPALQLPLGLGADIVIHSTTKYLCGNATALGGAVVGEKEFVENVRADGYRNTGPSMSPFNAWLTLLGMETLSLRMTRCSENAMAVAEFLDENPKVRSVNYPGLPSHPQHNLAKKQMTRFSSLLSFVIDGGFDEVASFMDSLQVITSATHLGCNQSIATHPASTTHGQLSDEELMAAGIHRSEIRLSVGLEDLDDLMEDVGHALGKI